MKLIDELWEDYAWVSHWKPDGTGVNMMDHEPFKQAMTEALERQRRGCAEAWLRDAMSRVSNPDKEPVEKAHRESGKYLNILNAPPAGEDE